MHSEHEVHGRHDYYSSTAPAWPNLSFFATRTVCPAADCGAFASARTAAASRHPGPHDHKVHSSGPNRPQYITVPFAGIACTPQLHMLVGHNYPLLCVSAAAAACLLLILLLLFLLLLLLLLAASDMSLACSLCLLISRQQVVCMPLLTP